MGILILADDYAHFLSVFEDGMEPGDLFQLKMAKKCCRIYDFLII